MDRQRWTWNDVAGASKYTLELDTEVNFANPTVTAWLAKLTAALDSPGE